MTTLAALDTLAARVTRTHHRRDKKMFAAAFGRTIRRSMRMMRSQKKRFSSSSSWLKSSSLRRVAIPMGTAALFTAATLTTVRAQTKSEKKLSSSPGDESYLERALSIVLVGADQSVAMEKTYPALYSLFKRGLLPKDTTIYCLTPSSVSSEEMKDSIRACLVLQDLAKGTAGSPDLEAFVSLCVHHKGNFASAKTMALLGDRITNDENKIDSSANRVFYLAVPEDSALKAARAIKKSSSAFDGNGGWTRLVLEKSSARDTEKSASRADELANLFDEKNLYRIDHYLGMEMVQNMLVMRFANSCFEPIWNRNHVAAVYVIFFFSGNDAFLLSHKAFFLLSSFFVQICTHTNTHIQILYIQGDRTG